MLNALDSVRCVVALCSSRARHKTFLHHVYKWAPTNLTLEVALHELASYPRGKVILYYCFRNWDRLLESEPLGLAQA